MLSDFYDAYQLDGAVGAMKTLSGVVGVGVRMYESKKPPDRR
jgi:hypothetical protein